MAAVPLAQMIRMLGPQAARYMRGSDSEGVLATINRGQRPITPEPAAQIGVGPYGGVPGAPIPRGVPSVPNVPVGGLPSVGGAGGGSGVPMIPMAPGLPAPGMAPPPGLGTSFLNISPSTMAQLSGGAAMGGMAGQMIGNGAQPPVDQGSPFVGNLPPVDQGSPFMGSPLPNDYGSPFMGSPLPNDYGSPYVGNPNPMGQEQRFRPTPAPAPAARSAQLQLSPANGGGTAPVPTPPSRPADLGGAGKYFTLDDGAGNVRQFFSQNGQAPNIAGMTAMEDPNFKSIFAGLLGGS